MFGRRFITASEVQFCLFCSFVTHTKVNFICFLFVAVDVSLIKSFLFLESFWWSSCSQSKFFAFFRNHSGLSGACCLCHWIQLCALSPIYICCFAVVFFADLRYFHMQKLTMYASILNKLRVFAPAESAFTVVLLLLCLSATLLSRKRIRCSICLHLINLLFSFGHPFHYVLIQLRHSPLPFAFLHYFILHYHHSQLRFSYIISWLHVLFAFINDCSSIWFPIR